MKKNLVLLALGALTFVSCQTQPKEDYSWIKKGLDAASAQLQLTAEEISSTNMLPRSIRTGYDMNFLCRQLDVYKRQEYNHFLDCIQVLLRELVAETVQVGNVQCLAENVDGSEVVVRVELELSAVVIHLYLSLIHISSLLYSLLIFTYFS